MSGALRIARNTAIASLLLALFGVAAAAQTGYTAVTATVTDPSGQPYANATYQITFTYQGPTGTNPLLNGGVFQTQVGGSLNSSGKMSVLLADNNVVSPGPSQWNFHICAQGGTPCFSALITITGTSQDISATLNANAPPLHAFTGGTVYGSILATGSINAQSIEQVRYADQFPGGTSAAQVASAEASLGGNGLVVLPSGMQAGNCGYTSQPPSDLLDLRGGGSVQTANLTFYCGSFDVFLNDASPRSTNPNAQADSSILPIVHVEGTERGAGTLGSIYWFTRSEAGATGGLYGLIGSVDAQTGARTSGVANNMVVGLDEEYSITAIARASNVVTATISSGGSGAGNTFQVGDCVHVDGVTDASFDSNALCFTLTAVNASGMTISWAQNGANASSSGGTVGLMAQSFGLELDEFADAWDPQPLTPITAQNTQPVWGFVGTGNGIYPGTAAFFSDGKWHNGFLCADAYESCFVAGYPNASGSPPHLLNAIGFESRPAGVATSTTNFASLPSQWDESHWNGSSYAETRFSQQLVPGSGTNPGDTFEFCYPATGTCLSYTSAGQLIANNGVASAPSIAFAQSNVTGLYITPGGAVALTEGGAERYEFDGGGGGVLSLAPGSANVTLTAPNVSGTIALSLSGTTASIGGSALGAGACTSGTVSVAGATSSMAVAVSPAADPGTGFVWEGWVSAAGTVTVRLCNVTSGSLTPTATAYNVRVIQ